ncbi:MAG: type II toxin-antitoxin system RelE/ParE family toxin [Candidatus Omnitrophota bacterium]
MAKYRIFETEQFSKDLKHSFGGQKDRIIKKLLNYVYPQLSQQPYFGKNIKKLINYKPETWLYRIGDYRFFYTIDPDKKIVFMIAADSRSNAY